MGRAAGPHAVDECHRAEKPLAADHDDVGLLDGVRRVDGRLRHAQVGAHDALALPGARHVEEERGRGGQVDAPHALDDPASDRMLRRTHIKGQEAWS